MPPDAASDLAHARRSYLVAAAGCGKTETVAWAAGFHADGRQLVLTHTHAGVKALKDRLRRIGATRGRVHVDTIAGFALRYAASFPSLSRLSTVEPTTPEHWNSVYEAAYRVFDGSVGRRVLEASYAGMFVDEYQDCIRPQHDLVFAMAQTMPCRVVLDPLQAIFGFAGPLVSAPHDLAPTFERLADLTTPWRWRECNPELGDWLLEVRGRLERGEAIELEGAPVTRAQASHAGRIAACRRLVGETGSAVAIGQWPRDCHSIASRLRGLFTSMEPMECPDLLDWAERLEEASGPTRALLLIEFAATCMTRVGTVLDPIAGAFRAGRSPRSRGAPEVQRAVARLSDVASEAALGPILPAMEAIEGIPERVLYRRELWREMRRSVWALGGDRHPSLRGAAWYVRDRGRHGGRRVDHRTVSRTLLVKGLEFDHAVVLDADVHDAHNLYVALTRGSQSLTVVSSGSHLRPRPRDVRRPSDGS
jgi:hypothetical protein